MDYGKAAEKMEIYGGSFVKKIAEAWFVADQTNKQLLQNAFLHYFEQYFNDFCKGSK